MWNRYVFLGMLLLGVVGFTTLPRLFTALDAPASPTTARPAPRTVTHLYRHHFRESRHERMFLASLAFFLTFGITRAITISIHAGRGPFHDIETQSGHVHHLVWGILLVLGVGYLWLIQVGMGSGGGAAWTSRLTALAFGAGAALTLDEFALWLTFRDVYWQREGRLSIDAVVLFGSLLSVGMWGGPFFRDLVRLWTA
jgi:hypothetical protein